MSGHACCGVGGEPCATCGVPTSSGIGADAAAAASSSHTAIAAAPMTATLALETAAGAAAAAAAATTHAEAPRRFRASGKGTVAGTRRAGGAAKRRPAHVVPPEILEDAELNSAIAALPSNYNFEIHKTVWKVRDAGAKRVALQMPEGLLLYAGVIADIVERFCGADTLIMGDVTYGACCVDDLTAAALSCDFMVHYGHSCLVPIDVTSASGVKLLYVFVDIAFDTQHLVDTVKANFPATTRLAILGTIQFAPGIHAAKRALASYFTAVPFVPQAKPLSPGEVLGCTSPSLAGYDAFVFVADGRFHLESAMIANPGVEAFRYDPYPKVLTKEGYDTPKMMDIRHRAVEQASRAKTFGVLLGTLGRQGSTSVLQRVEDALKAKGKKYFVMLLSEIFPSKLGLFSHVDAWIQIACPRLSIDWGAAFDKPLLSPYEAFVALDGTAWRTQYPMDFYSAGSGPWTNYHKTEEELAAEAARKAERAAARKARAEKRAAAAAAATAAAAADSATEASATGAATSVAATPPAPPTAQDVAAAREAPSAPSVDGVD